MKWWDQMPWSLFSECWVLSQLFHSTRPLSSRGSLVLSSLSAIRVVSSAYLRLSIFFPAILIPACTASSPSFLMMYSAYKLNKQGDNIQPWCTHFPIWNKSVVPCPVLTVHGILYTRILEWVAFRFSLGSFQPRDWTQVSHIAGKFFPSCATTETLMKVIKC